VKRVYSNIDFFETGIYKVNEMPERYFFKCFDQQTGPYIKTIYHSAYQICNVYTDQNTVLEALQKLNGEQATKQVFLDHDNKYIPSEYHSDIRSKIRFNDNYNCHGFTFLNAEFWFELDNNSVEILISDNGYQACDIADLKDDGVCLYYDYEGNLYHSAKMVNGTILSKFGINHLVTVGEEDILTRYVKIDHSRSVYLNAST